LERREGWGRLWLERREGWGRLWLEKSVNNVRSLDLHHRYDVDGQVAKETFLDSRREALTEGKADIYQQTHNHRNQIWIQLHIGGESLCENCRRRFQYFS
jgi:hypothetical protein